MVGTELVCGSTFDRHGSRFERPIRLEMLLQGSLLLLLLLGLMAAQQVPVGAPILGAHQHIDQGIDAGGQIDQQIAHYVEDVHIVGTLPDLGHCYRQIADDEPHEYHQNHLQQATILRAHPARIYGRGIRCVTHRDIVRFSWAKTRKGGAQRCGDWVLSTKSYVQTERWVGREMREREIFLLLFRSYTLTPICLSDISISYP